MISRPPISVSAPPTPRESLQESPRISFLRILFFRELVKKTLKSKRCSFVCPHGGWVAGGPTRGRLGDPMTYGPRGDHFRSFQAPPLSSYFSPSFSQPSPSSFLSSFSLFRPPDVVDHYDPRVSGSMQRGGGTNSSLPTPPPKRLH